MKFNDFFCSEAIIVKLESCDRDGVIAELVGTLHKAGKLGRTTCEEIVEAVIQKENEASTGMGKGIAVPHAKHKAIRKVVAALGLTDAGIDFSALDKQPVYSVILLLSPFDDPDAHLQAMEHIFRHLQNDRFRKFLRQSQTVEQIGDLLQEADENRFFK
jgi:mannitol/fructose-specific phosphotransferase system IIA component (Ntr-type)